MNLRRLLFLLSCCFLSWTAYGQAAEPPAQVIFYAPGGLFRGFAKQVLTDGIGKGDAPSAGFIFEDGNLLGIVYAKHYAAFSLTPGTHAFSTSQNEKKANPEETVLLTLEPGKQYFMTVTSTRKGAVIVQFYTSHLALSTCAEVSSVVAREGAKDMDNKRLEKHFSKDRVRLPNLAPCQPLVD